MRKKKTYGLTVLATAMAMFGSLLLHGQETMSLGLKQAIDLSVQNSKQLKVNRAKIEQATAQLRQAMDARLPEVKVSGAYLWLAHPNIKLKTGSDSGSTSFPSPSHALYGVATVNMPIYSGLRIRYGIESAQYLEKAAQADAENSKEAIVLNAISAYSNLYKSVSAVELVKENLNQSQQRDKDFINMEKNGLLARNDLLKAQLQTANIEMALVNAESNLKLAMVSLNLMMGIPEQTILQLDTTGFGQEFNLATIEAYEQQAFSNRKDIEALNLRKKAIGSEVKSVKGELLPSLGITGGYVAAYIPDLVTITNLVNIGVGVQYNLSSLWKTKAKLNAAKASEAEISANQEMLNDDIRLSINRAYQHYLSAQKKVEVQGKSVINATENYRITKNKHDNSLVTTTELLDANVALLESKIGLEEAKADVIVAYNTLLEQAGVLANSTTNK